MKKTNQPRMTDNYASMSWGRGDKLYASDLTKMSRQVDSNENELVDLTTTTIPKVIADVASHQSTLDEFAPKVAKIDVPEGSTIVKEIDKAVADLVNGAPETLDTIKEVADAIEQNGDAITALNDIVAKNKVAIEAVDVEQKSTAEKLDKLDAKAVKYQDIGDNRKTIQLANFDNLTGVTTSGIGINLAMVSKWDKADFGSAQIETNLNAKDGIVTINDAEVVATVKQVNSAVGQLGTKLEGELETVNSAIDTLGARIDTTKEQLNASIEAVKSYTDEQLETKQPVGDYPEFQPFSAGVDPAERKTIQLANADSISGVTTAGDGVNIAMVSKWNKVILGSSKITMNLNSLDGEVTINDGKVVATLDDVTSSEATTSALIDKKIADYHKESDTKFVSAKTTGRHSTVAVSTVDDEVRLSSTETNPTGSQGGVYVGSQLIQVMTSYRPSDRQEASLLMITPSRFDLKRRDAKGQMHEIELVDLITKANKVPGVEAGLEAVKTRVETLSGEVDAKTPLKTFEAFKTETSGEIQKVKGNVLQLSNNVYTKSEIDGKLTGAFHYKGSVETYAELPAEDLQVGDVWNVVQASPEHHVNAGDNVAWNGSAWDALCGIVDLSGYNTIEQVAQKIADAIAPKADKAYVDTELTKKATIAELEEHCGSFEQYKAKAEQVLDAKADQEFVVAQLATKVSVEQHEADKKAIGVEIDKRVDKETYKTDKGVLVSEINNKVSNTAFVAAKKELERALDEKQPVGSYVNKPEYDQFVDQYGKDKATFAVTAVVDEKLALKADKTYVNLELAKKAEKIHSHALADTEGLVEALAAKVEKEAYAADKATFAVKSEVEVALDAKANKSDVEAELAKKAVKAEVDKYIEENDRRVKAKVEQSVYDAHVENFNLELGKKLDKSTHESFVDTTAASLANKLDISVYNVDKANFATKSEIVAVYRYKGSVKLTTDLPKAGNIVGDVWNVEEDGANVAWDGEKWDKLGGPIDLSPYDKIEDVNKKIEAAKTELNASIDAKVAKVDFDSFKQDNTAEIERVEGKVDQEVKDRTAAITAVESAASDHQAAFEQFKESNTTEIARVEGKVDAEVVDRKAAITQEVKDRDAAIKVVDDKVVAHQTEFGEFKEANTAEIKRVEGKVDQEVTDRTAAVKTVDDKVVAHQAEFEQFKEANTAAIAKAVGDEATLRQGEDAKLSAAVAKEVKDRAAAIVTVNETIVSKVAEEAAARDVAIEKESAELQTLIEGKVDQQAYAADKATFATVNQLTTGLGEKVDAVSYEADKKTFATIDFVTEKVSSVYRYKGSVANKDALPKEGNVIGDVWNTEETGDNFAWDGSAWDDIGGVVDLSTYETIVNVDSKVGQAKSEAIAKAEQKATELVEAEKTAREVVEATLATKVEVEGKADKVHTHAESEVVGLTDKLSTFALKSELTSEVAKKADKVHTHVVGDVTGLEEQIAELATKKEVAAKAEKVHGHKIAEVEGLETELGKFATKEAVDDKAAKVHTHVAADITDLQPMFDAKAEKAHAHAMGDISGLETTLNEKAAKEHTHAIADVTGLQDALDAKMAASEASKFAAQDHNHDTAYLAIGGKAESAKVADSVAWTAVTGTEGVALKSDVSSLETKKANTDWVNKTFATKGDLDGYQAKGEYALKSELAGKMDATEATKFAQVAHNHTIADVTGLQDALDTLATKEELAGKAAASHTHQEGEIEGLTAKLATFVTNEALKRDYTNTTDLGQLLDGKLDITDGDKKYATKDELAGYQPKGEYVAKTTDNTSHNFVVDANNGVIKATDHNSSGGESYTTYDTEYVHIVSGYKLVDRKETSAVQITPQSLLLKRRDADGKMYEVELAAIVDAVAKAPVFVNVPSSPEPNYTEAAIAGMFGCTTIEQVGKLITGDRVVYLHFTSTGKDYKIPVQYCAFKADGSNDIVMITVGLDTTNDEVCKYKITIALNGDSSTIDVSKTPLVSPAA